MPLKVAVPDFALSLLQCAQFQQSWSLNLQRSYVWGSKKQYEFQAEPLPLPRSASTLTFFHQEKGKQATNFMDAVSPFLWNLLQTSDPGSRV